MNMTVEKQGVVVNAQTEDGYTVNAETAMTQAMGTTDNIESQKDQYLEGLIAATTA